MIPSAAPSFGGTDLANPIPPDVCFYTSQQRALGGSYPALYVPEAAPGFHVPQPVQSVAGGLNFTTEPLSGWSAMEDPGVCVKYPFEEATNLTRYSWFERSNMVAYEPGMRRRVAQRNTSWTVMTSTSSQKASSSDVERRNASPSRSSSQRDDGSPSKDTLSEDLGSIEDDIEGDAEVNTKPTSFRHPTIVVEHRWSFLFPRSARPGYPLAPPSFKPRLRQPLHSNSSAAESTSDGSSADSGTPHGGKEQLSGPDDAMVPQVTTVQQAFTSPAFGGRSSVLRCLVTDLEMRFISRTQMNYAFHLSAIAERVVHQGVYHLTNPLCQWSPVISNEPIDTRCALRLLSILRGPVWEYARFHRGDNYLVPQIDKMHVHPVDEAAATGVHPPVDLTASDLPMNAEPHAGEHPAKYQKVSDCTSAGTGIPIDGLAGCTDDLLTMERQVPHNQQPCPQMETLSLMPTSFCVPENLSEAIMSAIYASLISSYGFLESCSDADVSTDVTATEDMRERFFGFVRRAVGFDCPDALICGVVVSLMHMATEAGEFREPVVAAHCAATCQPINHQTAVDDMLAPFDPIIIPTITDVLTPQRPAYGEIGESNERLCLCCSKYAMCPTVFNEYITFGGTPSTPADMELGVWIFDSPFTRYKMRDVPTLYHQQMQYSTKKYITIADLNDSVLSTRALNLRLEFCGRGDWVFDDGTLPPNEGEKERPMYGKVLTAEDLMQLEFTGTANQVAKKFFLLQKAFLTTGKGGTSRLIFMDPYANIDASICEDKDYVDLLVDLLGLLHKQSPESFLASCNGYYYYEDGFLPENIDVQRLRNTLFGLESGHYRTAMLADVVADQKHVLGLSQKLPFLTKCKRVVIGKSRIHGYGLFAADTINKGDLIMEYAGVVISDYMADLREAVYDRLLCGSVYMFRLDLNHIIDSTFYGNCARFINHSCDPNTATTNFSFIEEDGYGTHVGVYASKVIPAGEEIFYNYRLSAGSANREVCHCGSYICTGYMSLVK